MNLFCLSYARFIGLDSQEVLTQFGTFLDDKALERPTREAGHSGYAFEKTGGDQNRTFLWVVMLSFIVIGGLLIIIIKPPLKHHRHRNAEKLQQVAATQPSTLPSPSLSPSPLVAPSSTPAVTVIPTSTPSPTPAPTTALAPTATPVVKTEDPEDKLNTGRTLKFDQIKHKVLIKSKAAVWVRYQVDDRPVMKFTLKKDGVLVLKASTSVRFQVSNPKSVTVSYNGSGSKSFQSFKGTAQFSSGMGLFYPSVNGTPSSSADPFPGQSHLPQSPDPEPEATPTQAAQ